MRQDVVLFCRRALRRRRRPCRCRHRRCLLHVFIVLLVFCKPYNKVCLNVLAVRQRVRRFRRRCPRRRRRQ